MGYFGKLQEKQQVQELRKQGYSYKEIITIVHVSKDTISRWCKDIQLTKAQKLHLIESKNTGRLKGSINAAKNKEEKKKKNLLSMQISGKKDIGELSRRDKFIAGVVLYAGEGTKMDGKGGFTNADPKLLKFMRDWLVDYAKVDSKKMRLRLWLHEGLNEYTAKEYWSKALQIPKNQFIKSYISKRTSSKKITKNLHKFGICALIFYDTNAHRRIISWISAMFNDKI